MSTDNSDRHSRDDVQTKLDALDGNQGLGADTVSNGETPAQDGVTPDDSEVRPDPCSCDEFELDDALSCWNCWVSASEGDR